ncbi:MAG: septum formation initiator family protein [Oscillospiraceae bacterium]|nr:septum formation initiator family protein [Oscillospiraceae bacterium]
MGKNKTAKNPLRIFGNVVIFISVIACFVSIISTQASLSEKRKELDFLKQQTAAVKDENEEVQRLFDDGDIDDYKEKLAIENMNYAYPNEIRFYDTSRN